MNTTGNFFKEKPEEAQPQNFQQAAQQITGQQPQPQQQFQQAPQQPQRGIEDPHTNIDHLYEGVEPIQAQQFMNPVQFNAQYNQQPQVQQQPLGNARNVGFEEVDVTKGVNPLSGQQPQASAQPAQPQQPQYPQPGVQQTVPQPNYGGGQGAQSYPATPQGERFGQGQQGAPVYDINRAQQPQQPQPNQGNQIDPDVLSRAQIADLLETDPNFREAYMARFKNEPAEQELKPPAPPKDPLNQEEVSKYYEDLNNYTTKLAEKRTDDLFSQRTQQEQQQRSIQEQQQFIEQQDAQLQERFGEVDYNGFQNFLQDVDFVKLYEMYNNQNNMGGDPTYTPQQAPGQMQPMPQQQGFQPQGQPQMQGFQPQTHQAPQGFPVVNSGYPMPVTNNISSGGNQPNPENDIISAMSQATGNSKFWK